MSAPSRPRLEHLDCPGFITFAGAPKAHQPAKASAAKPPPPKPPQPAQAPHKPPQPAPQPQSAETLDLDTVIAELWARDPATRADFVSLRSCQAFYRRTADERAETLRRAQPPRVRLIYPE